MEPLSTVSPGREVERRQRRAPWWLLVFMSTLVCAGALTFGPFSGPGRTAATSASVDFATVAHMTNAFAIGIGSSTYGDNPLSSDRQASVEQALDARYIRLPVGIREGKVSTSAVGAAPVDIAALVSRYRSWGYRVLVIIGGRSNDVDVKPGDATRIFQALGFDGIDYSAPNEPDQLRQTLSQTIATAHMILAEGRHLLPGFKLWGPAWSYYDRASIVQFAKRVGSGLAGVDYHRYAAGQTPVATEDLLADTSSWGTNVADSLSDLRDSGLPQHVSVDEVNISWRYQDGTTTRDGGAASGADGRFFTAVNTVFLASTCGHIMSVGGSCLPYATQNGALGMTVQAGKPNPDHRPVSSPMPGYWGIAAWTGAHRWSHMSTKFFASVISDPNLELFVVNNEDSGYNVILINKGLSASKVVPLELRNIKPGRFVEFQTDPLHPYDAPAKTAAGPYRNQIGVELPAMTVTVLSLATS